jgi:hypothetical protein
MSQPGDDGKPVGAGLGTGGVVALGGGSCGGGGGGGGGGLVVWRLAGTGATVVAETQKRKQPASENV